MRGGRDPSSPCSGPPERDRAGPRLLPGSRGAEGALWVHVRVWETRSLLLGAGPSRFGTPRSRSALRF